jgi:SEC-C motif-containing protein
MPSDHLCPCKSQKPYIHCCKKYHEGELPETALLLMRSRYSAYAKGLTHYIILSTHSSNPQFTKNRIKWMDEIESFSKETTFEDLKIVNFEEDGEKATVTFEAILKRGDQDISFKEKSFFTKIDNKWLYVSGELIK